MINSLFKLLGDFIPLTYLVLDGHFENNNALEMAQQVNLHIISKLRYDSALYIPYQNPDPNCRSRRKYGDKIDDHNIPQKYLFHKAEVRGHRAEGPLPKDRGLKQGRRFFSCTLR